MRYPACEKLEIIRLVEQSHLPVRRTLDKIGIPRPTFYRWYDLYRCKVAPSRSKRPLQARIGPGTAFRKRFSASSSTWRSRNRTCRPGVGRALHRHGKVLCVGGRRPIGAQGP